MIIVYIEKYLVESKEVLFDFYDSNGYSQFLIYQPEIKKNAPSFVLVKGYSGKRLREGSYYQFNVGLLKSLNFDLVTTYEDSPILGFVINMNRVVKYEDDESLFLDLFRPSWMDLAGFNPSQIKDLPELLNGDNTGIEIVIKRVGQGNWNEVYNNGKPIFVFDFGCTFSLSTERMMELFIGKEKEYNDSKPVLVISHWDLDHYCLLKILKNYNCFSFVYARTPPPNLTSRIIYSQLERELKDRFVRVACEESSKCRPKLLKEMATVYGFIKIFNGEKSSSRNISGMCCLIETNTGTAIFSADHHYDQIDRYVLGRHEKSKEVYVVPHHGGSAGRIIVSNYGICEKYAIISVGKNSYGHPKGEIIQEFKEMGYSVYITSHHHKDFKTKI